MTKYIINPSKKNRKIIASLFTFIFLLVFVYPGPAVSGEQRLMKPEWKLPEHYPQKGFHGWGLIDYFEGNEIVINDLEFRVSPYATFHTPDHKVASRYEFTPNKVAGFLFDENDEIISLWMITKKN